MLLEFHTFPVIDVPPRILDDYFASLAPFLPFTSDWTASEISQGANPVETILKESAFVLSPIFELQDALHPYIIFV